MPPKAGERGELSPANGRPIPNPEPFEAAILSDRSLAVRFEEGPWVRPTAEEVRLYWNVLGGQPIPRENRITEWFYQDPRSGRVRLTTSKDDKQGSRIGNPDEQNAFRRLFQDDQTATETKAFTCVMEVAEINDRRRIGRGAAAIVPPAANSSVPADVMPIDISSTPFAHAYSSKALATMTDKFPLLEHVNCSYLSTLHHAPTLFELKKHAQALAILIHEMSGPSTRAALVNNGGLDSRAFEAGEPFDWLNDLSKPYVNDNPQHHVPLSTLMNAYHHDTEAMRTTQVCPISSVPRTREASDAGQPGLPYMTLEGLTKHANDCLELLDHEFSAEGGLLAILPAMDEKSERNMAEKTLLGQYILFTQRLVQRVHELELRAANAADLLSGEKVIPPQVLGLIPGLNGRDKQRGAPVAYPQNKYVLANAGEQVWGELSKMLNVKEKLDRDLHAYNVQQGLSASSQWEHNSAMDFRSGITHIDVMTRYTRIWDANSVPGTPSPIFIIPGWAVHPGVKITREMESKPHVVQVVKPQYPERLSMLEEKYDTRRWEYENIINEHNRLTQEAADHLETIEVQQIMYKDLQAENSFRRAEQQGRNVQELASFRNPIAEKEKKLEATQRDLDQKLIATEYTLREAQRAEQAAQRELLRLRESTQVETTKLQVIAKQNAQLTSNARGGYLGSAGVPSRTGPRIITPADQLVDPLADVTDIIKQPYPSDYSGTMIYSDGTTTLKSQTIINGVLGPQVVDASPAEISAYNARVNDITTAVKEPQPGPLVVYTTLPGAGPYVPKPDEVDIDTDIPDADLGDTTDAD